MDLEGTILNENKVTERDGNWRNEVTHFAKSLNLTNVQVH